MDLIKAQKVLRKNFKDHCVKADIDEETLMAFICVDLIREDMNEAPTPSRSGSKKPEPAIVKKNEGEVNGSQQPAGGSQTRSPLYLGTPDGERSTSGHI